MKKQPKPANTKVARDPDGRWKKGTPSPNPKGRAPEGESWGSVFKHVFSMTPEEAAQYSGEIGKRLKQYGAKKITTKSRSTRNEVSWSGCFVAYHLQTTALKRGR